MRRILIGLVLVVTTVPMLAWASQSKPTRSGTVSPTDPRVAKPTALDRRTPREKTRDQVDGAIGEGTLCSCQEEGVEGIVGQLGTAVGGSTRFPVRVVCRAVTRYSASSNKPQGSRNCVSYEVIGQLPPGQTL